MTRTLQTTQPLVKAKPSVSARLDLGLRPAVLGLLLVSVVAAMLLLLTSGSIRIPLGQVLVILTGGEATRVSWHTIVLDVRLPKAITALLAGAALGVSGLTMQTFFRNPLAGPDVLGLSAGATLGVALVVLAAGSAGTTLLAGLGLRGGLLLVAAAATGAGLVMLLVLAAAGQAQNAAVLLILGVMVGQLVGAAVSLLMVFTVPERMQVFLSWTFGTFGGVTWGQMRLFALVVGLGLALASGLVKPLNALLLGEATARTMGLHTGWARTRIIATTALLAGTVTAFCGPIAFIGVAVPHLGRALLRTSDHRLLLPACALLGATVALLAALIAEVPGHNAVLPVNVVTALFGAPVVLMVILRQQHSQQVFGP